EQAAERRRQRGVVVALAAREVGEELLAAAAGRRRRRGGGGERGGVARERQELLAVLGVVDAAHVAPRVDEEEDAGVDDGVEPCVGALGGDLEALEHAVELGLGGGEQRPALLLRRPGLGVG